MPDGILILCEKCDKRHFKNVNCKVSKVCNYIDSVPIVGRFKNGVECVIAIKDNEKKEAIYKGVTASVGLVFDVLTLGILPEAGELAAEVVGDLVMDQVDDRLAPESKAKKNKTKDSAHDSRRVARKGVKGGAKRTPSMASTDDQGEVIDEDSMVDEELRRLSEWAGNDPDIKTVEKEMAKDVVKCSVSSVPKRDKQEINKTEETVVEEELRRLVEWGGNESKELTVGDDGEEVKEEVMEEKVMEEDVVEEEVIEDNVKDSYAPQKGGKTVVKQMSKEGKQMAQNVFKRTVNSAKRVSDVAKQGVNRVGKVMAKGKTAVQSM